jgi:hypothetical protein
MNTARARRRISRPAALEPLSPKQKWRTITVATLILLPAFWGLVAGLVAAASGSGSGAGAPNAGAAIALGIAVVPFVFIALAFLGAHPHPPGAVLRAMGLAFVVGIPVSAIAGDAVTGIVAGVGAGGIAALRADPAHRIRDRAVAVLMATGYTFVLVRTVGAPALLAVPVFPLTAIGLADHLSERRVERALARAG